MNFLTNLNLNQNQLLQAVIENLAIAPASPREGQIYYNTALQSLQIFDGFGWMTVGAGEPGTPGEGITAEKIVELINNSVAKIKVENVEGLTELLENNQSSLINQMQQYVDGKIAALAQTSPEVLDTLEKIGQALKDDPNLANVLTDGLAKKAGRENFIIGNDSDTEFTLSHTLHSNAVIVQIFQNSAPFSQVIADVDIVDMDTIKVKFAKPPTSNSYKVVILG